MKVIASIILLFALSGCITFPLPGGSGKNLHYGHSKHTHSNERYYSYYSPSYYPWWSMDYFYLRAGYGSPWFDYYSPWFYPHYFTIYHPPGYWPGGYRYVRYPSWNDPYWHDRYRQYEDTAYPDQPVAGTGLRAGDFLGQSARVANGEPLETGDTMLRRTSYGYPGAGSYGSMTVVSPANSKQRPSRAGPTRGTSISASRDSSRGYSSPPSIGRPGVSSSRPSSIGSRSMGVERHRASSTRDRN